MLVILINALTERQCLIYFKCGDSLNELTSGLEQCLVPPLGILSR